MLAAYTGVVSVAQPSQTINIVAVTNSADFQPGLPQKGSLASIFCTGLEGAPGIIMADRYPLSSGLNGITVWINFLPAPILAVAFESGYQQINVQVPWEGLRDPLYVEVFQNGIRAHTENTQANAFSVFFSNANGYGIVQHSSDYSPVNEQNPAHAGEYLTAYGINLGPVNNTPASGVPSPLSPLSTVVQRLPGTCGASDQLRIGSVPVSPTFEGLAPGYVGVYQINFQVPLSVPAGDLPLSLVRDLQEQPFGMCTPDHEGYSDTTTTSRSVLLPVR